FHQLDGGLNVFGLSFLASSSQQDNQMFTLLIEVNPVAGSIRNPQLRNTFPNRFYISRIPSGESSDSNQYLGFRHGILQPVQPSGKGFCFADFHKVICILMDTLLSSILNSVQLSSQADRVPSVRMDALLADVILRLIVRKRKIAKYCPKELRVSEMKHHDKNDCRKYDADQNGG